MTRCLQLGSKLTKIVDFTIEYGPYRAVLVEQGLIPPIYVDHSQATYGEPDPVLNIDELGVGPTMRKTGAHRTELFDGWLDTGSQGIVVHRDALIRYPDGRLTVWVINQEGDQATVTEHPVQTGLSFNGKVAVIGGLAPNTLVVVQGNESLRDGQSVVVRRAE